MPRPAALHGACDLAPGEGMGRRLAHNGRRHSSDMILKPNSAWDQAVWPLMPAGAPLRRMRGSKQW
jgi:hypothetical protein